jgi:LPXTG-site transpeptidase (sortase) family protein
VEIIEPELTLEKTVDPTVAVLGSFVTVTLQVEHAASSAAPAYDVVVTDNIPTGLALVTTSIIVDGSASLPTPVVTTASNLLTVYWSAFPLGASARVTFEAQFLGPPPVINTASVEWSSLQIDPAPRLQPQSPYNRYSTERRYDPFSSSINDYRAESSATVDVPRSPETGFPARQRSVLPVQPKEKSYQQLGDLWLEIPRLGLKVSIVGVPLGADNEWDVTWLGSQAGYLNGTAYPTRPGNSVLTGHVYTADGLPGPFIKLNQLNQLRYGDEIIVHLAGQSYVYEVRENRIVSPHDGYVFRHQDYPWLTLVTCRDYDERTNSYRHRVAVGAVLVRIE